MAPVQRHFFLLKHPLDNLQGFVERLQASRNRFEVDSETTMFELEPSCAETEVETAIADVIERRRHLGRDARVAISVAVHHRANSRAFRLLAECGERGPSFHARAGGVGNEDWIEVIEGPQRVVAPTVRAAPQVSQLFPFNQLLAGLNSESNWMRRHCDFLLTHTRKIRRARSKSREGRLNRRICD